ncbi:MAG: polyisoprenoid-binding protein [Frateuria sp.]|uniref:YceI family protein n=1 Tax=Frateuria sp. TaxID=2211372 RepID=UPI00181EAE75|nr:YceI family protein [Frateuria sp.]NUO73847.1 polyisoprenoid-binding protein [Frateuria sp.]NUR23167.1 polyisoprenoid-binding protein [Frateuria sp.]
MHIASRTVRRLLPLALLLPFAAGAAPVRYTLDPAHTYPSFEADHMGMSTWRGKLDHSEGWVELDRAAGSGSVEVSVALDSIDFGQEPLNAWARGKDFFNVAQYPRAVYRGQLAGFVDGAPTRVEGTLSLHGVTRPMTLRIDHFKCMPHPIYKRDWCGADALGSFDRSAFGLDAGKSYGFDMQVALRIQVEAVRDK